MKEQLIIKKLTDLYKYTDSRKRPRFEVLSRFLLESDGHQLIGTATDLTRAKRIVLHTLEGNHNNCFSLTVPAKLFKDIMKVIIRQKLSYKFEFKHKQLLIQLSNGYIKLNCGDPDDFPCVDYLLK